MNLPNILTLSRILLIPFFVLVYLIPGGSTYVYAAALFALAAFTDWLDGYLARRLEQTTTFGAFLDPVADKLIVVSALVLLIGHHANIWLTLPGLVIVGREIVISALREWMAEMNRRGAVKVTWIGRIKTTCQMVAIVVLLANPPDFTSAWVWLGYAMLDGAALLTLWTMVMYLQAAWPTLRHGFAQQVRPGEPPGVAPARKDG